MIRQIDHIVILVKELEQAIADYTALGFTVVRGGDHPGGATHNALVIFEDGAYFELIAFKQPAEEHHWWRKGARVGEGLLDYALLPGAIAEDIAAARARGLALEGPNPGGRWRPDGVQVAWQIGRGGTPDLPFLCCDVTPRALRVPEGAVRRHANGAAGVAAITVAVANLEQSIERYHALLGAAAQEERAEDPAGDGLRKARFRLGTAVITLAQPVSTGNGQAGALRRYLEAGGEGPFVVALRAAHETATGPLDARLTHGAQLEFGVTDPVPVAGYESVP